MDVFSVGNSEHSFVLFEEIIHESEQLIIHILDAVGVRVFFDIFADLLQFRHFELSQVLTIVLADYFFDGLAHTDVGE
jgi:hypothetical protein